ncbi:hypothetical protein L249_2553 [Ophiocordyceps polyrhachis-furcata BCC 54312]|uniref:Acyl-CoA dehydrogenase/oxidase C-terminal domain-containing protein n=1 Tax=Ophiocordyceps polyrhachis-furcata BCC 54312 TaxID=1330021 RepID=A0A367LQK9_9HYPO|nr:hypothetical protein L249_2553 [Ophiocordyceps polyrhachis-furcata BCC 54312]
MSRLITRRLGVKTPRRWLMSMTGLSESQVMVREAVAKVCLTFPPDYWRQKDVKEEDPKEFHAALASNGWLGIALPESHGGSGLGISEATMMMQTVTESGGGMAAAQAIHGNVYATQPLVRFGSQELVAETVPAVVSGAARLCFAVTEPDSGLDTLSLTTSATRINDDEYSISGRKIWITCAQVASKMLLLARTGTARDALSLFCIDLDRTKPQLTMRRIRKMGSRAVDANEVCFDDYRVPVRCRLGPEGSGFRAVLHGLNAERCLLAGEALGLGYAALERASSYARQRVVFGRPIGTNQGVAHPLADAYMRLEAARHATYHAARAYDDNEDDKQAVSLGVAANSAKYLAAEAAFTACERAVLAHGGMGYAAEYDVERWFRDSLVPRIAPVSREMILNFIGEKVLRLPRSY